MKIVCISDTHGQHEKINLPEGDVLVHAGDFTGNNILHIQDLVNFSNWFSKLDFKHKILIAGNHDFCMEYTNSEILLKEKDIIYLRDSGINIDGIKFWGSPWQPYFYDWAFNLGPDELKRKWDLIPDDTNVLVTHGPPFGIGDKTEGVNAGCKHLLNRIKHLKKLKLHVFGHIHQGYGVHLINETNAYLVNCSILNKFYKVYNKPYVFDLSI